MPGVVCVVIDSEGTKSYVSTNDITPVTCSRRSQYDFRRRTFTRTVGLVRSIRLQNWSHAEAVKRGTNLNPPGPKRISADCAYRDRYRQRHRASDRENETSFCPATQTVMLSSESHANREVVDTHFRNISCQHRGGSTPLGSAPRSSLPLRSGGAKSNLS